MIASSTDMSVKEGVIEDYTTTFNSCATSIPVNTKATSSVGYGNNKINSQVLRDATNDSFKCYESDDSELYLII